MSRLVLVIALLAGPAFAQSTVPVADAPFKQSGSLAGNLDPMEIVDSDIYEIVPPEGVTGLLLSRSRVVDFKGEKIGDESAVIENEEGFVGIVLGAGGLGGALGHAVAIPLEALVLGRSEEIGDSRIVVGLTEAELATLPPFEG